MHFIAGHKVFVKMCDESKKDDKVPEDVKNAVLVHSSPLPAGTPTVKGKQIFAIDFYRSLEN